MTRFVLSGLLLMGSVAYAQEPAAEDKKAPAKVERDEAKHKEAVEFLKKVDAAAKAVQTVRYDSTWKPTGYLAELAGSRSARVSVGPKVEGAGDSPKIKVVAKVQRTPSAEMSEFTMGFDGDEFYLIDNTTKKVHVDIDSAVIGSDGALARSLLMQEYTHPQPFTDEIKSDKAEILRKEMFGGEECSVIHVVYQGGQGEAVWWFSNKDHLPRQREQMGKNREGQTGSWVLTVSNLETDPKWTDKDFALVIPEGFEKTDEFAPRRGAMN